jgi:hypothetical protein
MGIIAVDNLDGSRSFKLEDRFFVNTAEFCRAGQFYRKHGVYTKASPKWDKREFKQFWDIEEDRCINGYSVGGVRITGDHYAYLNYREIKLTKDKEDKLKGEKVVKDLHYSATKEEQFPDFWDGDYYYYHAVEASRNYGLHLCVGKSRRKGYSYKNSTITGNRYNFIEKSVSLVGAYLTDYLYPEGTMKMTVSYLDFLNKHTDWNKRRLYSSMDFVESGFKIKGKPEKYGFQSKVTTASFKDNPGAARGKDATLILLEEAGRFPNLLASYKATYDTCADGKYTTGQIIIFGTGGGSEDQWEDFEELFYNPLSHGLLPFVNVWDEDADDEVCGFFHPDMMNLKGFIDKEGNSEKQAAKNYEDSIQAQLAKESNDPSAIDQRAMEHPNSPSQAFKRSVQSVLPITQISNRIKLLKYDSRLQHIGREGKLIVNEKGYPELVTNEELKREGHEYHHPINEFPLKHIKDIHGCIVEWYAPFMVGDSVPAGLNVIWHDPYATDKDLEHITFKESLGAAYVFEKSNKYTQTKGIRLAASWVGRPMRMDDYNEQLFLLAKRYNAKIFFENDRGDVVGYAKRHKLMEYLEGEPDILWSKDLQGKTGRNYGMHMNDLRKSTALIYLRDLLTLKLGRNWDSGEEKTFLDYIYDIALLEELRKFKKKGNFDRTSALLVGMFNMKEDETKELIINELERKVLGTPVGFFERDLF